MSSTRADPRHRIARLRLRNQRLAGPLTGASALRTPADVVAWMGAVQAQEYPYARWSVGQPHACRAGGSDLQRCPSGEAEHLRTVRRSSPARPALRRGRGAGRVDGRTYWSAANDGGTASRRAAPRAHLLQVYDEYVVAYRESRDLLDLDHLAGRLPSGQVMFLHAVILDGQFIGGWRRQVTKTALVVETQLARPLSDAEATAVEEAVARHGAFVGLPADWVRTNT